ncbi:MAG: hypothetical protein QM831_12770 [Kofleriaceae bacterium]
MSDLDRTGEVLGTLFAETLVQLSAGQSPAPLVGIVREQGKDKFDIHIVPDQSLDGALRVSSKPTVQDAAWISVTDRDESQTISMCLCAKPGSIPPFSAIIEVSFDDDDDTLYVSKPEVSVPTGADYSIPEQLWPAINRGLSRHPKMPGAPIVFGDDHFDAPI